MAVKAGDKVVIVSREVTSDDAKSGLYYAYFGGLTGTVDRVYPDGSVCVDVDLESLSEDARRRHFDMQEAERQRWLDSLSDEARNRLTPEQKQLKMSYRILVSKQDLQVMSGGKPASEQQPEKPKSAAASASGEKQRPEKTPSSPPGDTGTKQRPSAAEPQPRRLSEADLAAAEEAFLRSRRPAP